MQFPFLATSCNQYVFDFFPINATKQDKQINKTSAHAYMCQKARYEIHWSFKIAKQYHNRI